MSPEVTSGTGRPVRPALTYDYIIRTAMELIDRDGAEALSMRKLGRELGADPMAVYYHVPNKGALFDGVVRAVYADIDTDDLPWSGPGLELVAAFARKLRGALRRHPGAVPVVATRPVYTPSNLVLGERAIARLRGEGFTPRHAMTLVSCVQDFTVGQVLAELGAPAGGPTATPEEATAVMTDYPNLAAAIADGYQPDEQYELGLRALLDGFARLRSTAAGAGEA